ncbi:MAG TPA: glycosyltransferase family 9 protein [Gammaproteobacteria bacterium]|nr:glycosyltransferase family 9 protein [Gammaproteobacteria bacterium]
MPVTSPVQLPLTNPPRSVCVLRLSAIGDTCHTLTVVRRLQAAWPDTRITWIIGKTEAALLADINGVEFITFDKRSGLSGMRELGRKLADRQFDVLLHMQAALRASILSLFIPARLRLGFDKNRARDFQWLFTNARITSHPRQHVLEGLQGFADALGVPETALCWDIPVPEATTRFAQSCIDNKPTLLISPCSSQRARNFRNWPAQRYAQIVDYAATHYNMQTLLTGGPSALEKEYGERITQLATHKPVNLIGKTSLKELFSLIKHSNVILCPDSGPAHMATAAGTPVIGLYATSNPLRTGPYCSQQWTINAYPQALEAEGRSVNQVSWGMRVRKPMAMEIITVDQVTAKLDTLVATQKGNDS